jgi:hypothetical protein
LAWSSKGKVTRRERFSAEMDAVFAGSDALALIEPHYPTEGGPAQRWFNLSAPQAEDEPYDGEVIRRFGFAWFPCSRLCNRAARSPVQSVPRLSARLSGSDTWPHSEARSEARSDSTIFEL